MTRDAFDALVSRLDTSWRDQPRRLMLRTIGMGILGYAALSFAILGGLLIAGGGVWTYHANPNTWGVVLAVVQLFAGLLWSSLVVKCLWVRIEPPQGLRVTEADAPELFKLISLTGDRSGGVTFHQVLIDGGLNASVVQLPRLGVFGWYRSTLVIGLPLMQSLSPVEFQAVLAHEFAHSGQSDGKIGSWLHRTRCTWEKVAERMGGTTICPLFTRFFNWFWPRVNAPALVLSRSSEFACDRFAARLTSPEILARGLRRLAIQGRRLEEDFWKPLLLACNDSSEPPAGTAEKLMRFLREQTDPAKAQRWLETELKQTTHTFSTHPSLSERLDRLQQSSTIPAVVPPPLGETAAENLLPHPFSAQLQKKLSECWLEAARGEWWRSQRSTTQPQSAGESCQTSKEIRQAWSRIAALSRVDGLAKVQSDILALLNRKPDHCGALYLRGCHLAKEGDPHAIGFLERAANDPTLAVRTFETLAEYHDRAGHQEEVAAIKRRADQHERTLRAALVERNHIGLRDTFVPHGLPEAQIEALREVLSRHPIIHKAALVEKYVRNFPAWRHYILILDLRWPALAREEPKAETALLAKILNDWEVDGYVLALREHPDNRRLIKVIRHACPNGAVFRRS